MTKTKAPLTTPFWLRFAALGLIAPIFILVAFGAPTVDGILGAPWLIWSVAIFNAGCGIVLLKMSNKN